MKPGIGMALLLAPALAHAAWIELKSGPFMVLTEAGGDAGREALNHLEQYRHAIGQAMGKTDLKSKWPIVIVVNKGAKGGGPTPFLGFSRAGYMGTWTAGNVPPPAWFDTLGRILLDSNLKGRMPSNTEAAFLALYSTLEVKGTKLTLGAPPPKPTLDWARLQMLATKPETSGKIRVLLANLSQGAEDDPSYRNAFEKSKAALDVEAKAYLASGTFGTVAVNGRPIDPDRQFREFPASPTQVKLIPADLLMAQGAAAGPVKAAYQLILNQGELPAAQEGRGLALLAEGDAATARLAFDFAVADQPESAPPSFLAGPRAFFEAGKLEKNWPKAQALLEKALQKNPQWGDPWFAFAEREPGPNRRAMALEKAAELAPRNYLYWRALAEAMTDIKNFEGATKAWQAAERVAPDDQRDGVVQARLASEQRRLDQEAEERRRKAQAERDEVEKLRLQSLENIRKAEAKTRGTNPPLAEGTKVEKWWDGPPAEKLAGTLERVDCLGKPAKLHVKTAEGKTVLLLIPDPTQVLILGEREKTFSCGLQKPARKVQLEYLPKPNARMATIGDVTLLEFQ